MEAVEEQALTTEPMDEEEDNNNEHELKRKIMESFTNALRKSTTENVILEIDASRHEYKMNREAVLPIVTQSIIRAGEDCRKESLESLESLWIAMKVSLIAFKDVLRNYTRKISDQVLVMNAIELLMEESPKYLPVVSKIFYELNQTFEILDDEVVVQWFKKGGAATSAFSSLKKEIHHYVEWLEMEGEESDDDDDSEDQDD